jgi:D-glycero-beta-D-manno-heptose-7-phosphate kinase
LAADVPIPPPDVHRLIGDIADRRVLVVGDLVLDEYLVGRASRLSREAPVPVLELVERFYRLGAAANPAVNVASLGGKPTLIGVVGDDLPGRQLLEQLASHGVDAAGVVVAPRRTTAIKTRIMARHAAAHPQQVARIDAMPAGPLPNDVEQALIERLAALIPTSDAVLVSNYRAGVVSPRVIEMVVSIAAERRIPTCVDTQGDLTAFRGITVVKSNQPDAEAALGVALRQDADFEQAGRLLLQDLGSNAVVITRGAEGLSLIESDGRHTLLPPTNRTEVWDVTGAGDTVIAVLALGLAAGAGLVETAQLANAAAGIVVRHIGVATVTPAELAEALGHHL